MLALHDALLEESVDSRTFTLIIQVFIFCRGAGECVACNSIYGLDS